MKINKVTITGPDDKTNIGDLVELSKKYPFVEWGILFSNNKVGSSRYPSIDWIKEVVKLDLPLSAHFCGWWAKQVLNEQNFGLITEADGFGRIQLNYNFKHSKKWDLDKLLAYAKGSEKNIILQYNKSNAPTMDALTEVPDAINFLYDASGGRGTVIKDIHPPIGKSYTGYAGGLNPDNVGDICESIKKHRYQDRVWIDLESGARTNNEFDLTKVESILETSGKYMAE